MGAGCTGKKHHIPDATRPLRRGFAVAAIA
jgi:hypothetical protein